IAVVPFGAHPALGTGNALELGCRDPDELVGLAGEPPYPNAIRPRSLLAYPANSPIRHLDTVAQFDPGCGVLVWIHRRSGLIVSHDRKLARTPGYSRPGAARCWELHGTCRFRHARRMAIRMASAKVKRRNSVRGRLIRPCRFPESRCSALPRRSN